MTIRYIVEKCKTKAAYSARLQQKGKLNLAQIKEKFDVILETPILLVITVDGIEIIVHNYGELLFKEGDDIEWMKQIAERIYEQGLSI
ncbi:MAG: hypothetical protein Q8R37_01195 [Nanoarchaeota archaeon]|nr:hypothetical protein [Nanoarchaeota archaeon]